jgi:RNA-binding protein NOB1
MLVSSESSFPLRERDTDLRTCRDLDKKFCPSCGNATLLRTTVSTSSSTGKQTIHLKKNFQYSLRGSKFTIPDSKAGQAKGQQKSGNGLILREDQREWQDAVKSEDVRRQKEERKLAKGVLDGWDNPDVSSHFWFEILAYDLVVA